MHFVYIKKAHRLFCCLYTKLSQKVDYFDCIVLYCIRNAFELVYVIDDDININYYRDDSNTLHAYASTTTTMVRLLNCK